MHAEIDRLPRGQRSSAVRALHFLDTDYGVVERHGLFEVVEVVEVADVIEVQSPRSPRHPRRPHAHDPPHATPLVITHRLVTRAVSGMTEGSSLMRVLALPRSDRRVSSPNETLGRPASHTATVPSP